MDDNSSISISYDGQCVFSSCLLLGRNINLSSIVPLPLLDKFEDIITRKNLPNYFAKLHLEESESGRNKDVVNHKSKSILLYKVVRLLFA